MTGSWRNASEVPLCRESHNPCLPLAGTLLSGPQSPGIRWLTSFGSRGLSHRTWRFAFGKRVHKCHELAKHSVCRDGS